MGLIRLTSQSVSGSRPKALLRVQLAPQPALECGRGLKRRRLGLVAFIVGVSRIMRRELISDDVVAFPRLSERGQTALLKGSAE